MTDPGTEVGMTESETDMSEYITIFLSNRFDHCCCIYVSK